MRSKYGLSKISNKEILIDWKDYEAIYGTVSHHLPTNILLKPMKEGEEVEVEVGTRNSSLIRLVNTKSDFTRDEVTRLVTDQNAALNSRGGGGEKSTGEKGEVGLPMPGVVVVSKV